MIRDSLVAAYGQQGFGREAFKDSIDAICYGNQVDPFLEYLESLPDWDGTPRLDGLLHSLFVVAVNNPSELVAWVGQFLFVGPVYRTYHPGAKLDEVPVLIGGQGMGKSTALRKLLPPWGADDWFADGLSLAATDKEVGEAVENRVIVEISEMAGIRRAELERLKSWISRTNDGYFRRAYARYAVSAPRRCIIVGTTNTLDCLPNDPSGNRRFVPVTLADGSPADIREYLDTNREQLWGEGLHRYRAGEHPRLPDNLKVIQTAHNERHRDRHRDRDRDRDTALEDTLTTWLTTNPADSYTLADIAKGVGLLASYDTGAKLPRADQNRLSTALRAAGFESQRRWDGSKKVWSWARI